MKQMVLFICTHNSARSQMAEGLLNALYGDRFDAFSAGTEKTRVNPHAVKVMAEIGIDISHHRSKTVEEYRDRYFDLVVTVCDRAKETCPFFPGKKVIHKSFSDPSADTGDASKIFDEFLAVRDEIKSWIERLFRE